MKFSNGVKYLIIIAIALTLMSIPSISASDFENETMENSHITNTTVTIIFRIS